MNTSKIIKGVVGGGRYAVTAPIVKEDYGLYLKIEGLELPETYQVDFSNDEHSGTSVTMIGNADGVLIPRQFISSGKDVFAFLYHVGEDFGRTVYKFRIPNKVRPDRTNEQPTPEEQSTIDQAISALNEAVEQTAQDKADADASAQSASESAENASARATMAQNYADNAQGYANLASDHARTASKSALDSQVSAEASAQSAQTASAKADAITGLTATATTLPSGSSASASYDAQTGVMSFGIPKGKDGTNGIDGDDGYSPTASVTKSGKTATITITDKTGTTSAQVEDGEDGATGATPNLTIGTVETLEPSESATASITGTPENPVLNLGIPQGEQGEVTLEEFYKAFPTDTASGAVASFTDGADGLPLKSLVVNIDPVQDLHGQDAPYPAGGGKNLLPAEYTETITLTKTFTFSSPLPAGTYTLSFISSDTESVVTSYQVARWKDTSGANAYSSINPSTKSVKFTNDEPCSRIVIYSNKAYNESSGFTTVFTGLMLESGGKTEYAPYENICPISGWTGVQLNANGTVVPISWQTEAGTVYGGRLDVLSGELVVTHGYLQKNTADMNNGEDYPGWKSSGIRELIGAGVNKNLTGTITNISAQSAGYGSSGVGANTNGANDLLLLTLGKTQSEWKALALDVQFVIPLPNPIEIQLSPNQINSLYGVNNIFADTGDSEVEYRADTKLYIERLTAPDSADMIADANIQSGKYFMVGNSLYKATANIANGSAIIVGTNCIRKSLSEALNEINA